MPPVTCIIRCKLPLILISCLAAIAADHYSHLPYFGGRRDAYDDYYDSVVDIGEVTILEFATRVQELLVDYIRENMGTLPPIGVAIFRRAIVAGCVSRMLDMPGATTT